jgi:hypothetical protein
MKTGKSSLDVASSSALFTCATVAVPARSLADTLRLRVKFRLPRMHSREIEFVETLPKT